jgi:hypothetical protein
MTLHLQCVEYVYTLNRANSRAFGTRKPKPNADQICRDLTEQRDFRLTLSDGFEVGRKLDQEAAARTMPFVWIAIALWGVFITYRIGAGTRRSLRR